MAVVRFFAGGSSREALTGANVFLVLLHALPTLVHCLLNRLFQEPPSLDRDFII